MKVPPLLAEVAFHAAAVLIDAGVPSDVAQFVGRQIAGRVGRMLGGRKVYLPRGTNSGRGAHDFAAREVRNLEIYRAFNGRNIAELVRVYRLHEITISKVLRDVREDIRARRTPVPPPMTAAEREPFVQPEAPRRPRIRVRRLRRVRVGPPQQPDIFEEG